MCISTLFKEANRLGYRRCYSNVSQTIVELLPTKWNRDVQIGGINREVDRVRRSVLLISESNTT